jgi:serine/threonine-protein kinase RsbW
LLSAPADRNVPPNVLLSLASRPENVVLVRQMLGGLAEAIELDAAELNDISTAITEACNNVVVHAYDGGEGPLEVAVYVRSREIEVVVRDHGRGMRPATPTAPETDGLGLPVIHALACGVAFRDTEAGGTELQMAFATPRAGSLEQFREDDIELPAIFEAELGKCVGITIAPASLARAIVPRLLSVFAARAHFRTDRIADLELVADALTAHVPDSIHGRHLSIAIKAEPHDLEVRIAPLHAGGAERLLCGPAVDGLLPVIGTLTDHHSVAPIDCRSDAEMLALRLLDRR